MKIDLHIHTRTGSDGNFSVEEVFREAKNRGIDLISITDHDSIECQQKAISLASEHGITYITGVELNVTFELPDGNSISLDFLGYRFDHNNRELKAKLQTIREHRKDRARQILQNLNGEFEKEGIESFTEDDFRKIQLSVDGSFGRPHIADYLIEKKIVEIRQEAFDKYLVKCDVPKYPLSLAEAAKLVRAAGGILIFAHPNDPNGTSLAKILPDLNEQTRIIENQMMDYIDGVECWHSRHDSETVNHYVSFAEKNGLIMTGGSDCHQKPILMGTVSIPDSVAGWMLG